MGEQHPAGQAPAAGTGEFIDASLSPAPEAISVLGEDVVRYMDRASVALAELGEMAETEDPFVRDNRGSQVDLSFLKPEQAALVLNYRPGSGPFRGESGKTIAKFGRKVLVKMPGIHKEVNRMVDDSGPLDETKATVKGISDSMSETSGISVLGSLRQAMEELMAARNRLPSPATMVVVDNLYAAGLSARNYVSSKAAQRHIGTPGFIRKFTDDMKEGRENFKGTARLLDKKRRLGTANFNWLQTLIDNERIKEALGVISAAEAARRKLPEDTDGLEAEEMEAVRAAEQYLAGYSGMAASVLQTVRPELLEDKGVKAVLGRLNPPAPAEETKEQPERHESVGNAVLSKLTETKNVLRGGGRLKPGKGQTESYIRATADGLYALKDVKDAKMLGPEETGLIMAMVTGRFDELAEVIDAVQRHERAYGPRSFPAERSSVIREICSFDLQSATEKIDGLMNDPDARLKLERILGIPDANLVRECLSEALQQKAK